MKVKAKYIGAKSENFNGYQKQVLWLEFFKDGSIRASLYTYTIDPLRYKYYADMKEFFEDWTNIRTKGEMDWDLPSNF